MSVGQDVGNEEWSPLALQVCEACSLFWCLAMVAGCTYLVFWMDQSGWWYLLAMVLCDGWTCKRLRSPAQLRADRLPPESSL